MAKQDIETTDYTWDDGTYQTGAAQPGKGQSGIIAGLLAATIFLGGIASALGIMNIRLLQQLGRQEEPVLPISLDGTAGSVSSFLRNDGDHTPQLPEKGRLELNTAPSGPVLEASTLQEKAAASLAAITVHTGSGENTGAALILTGDGYLLTNAHLLDNASQITVTLPDGQVLQAAQVGRDCYSDLAVLYVSAQGLGSANFASVSGQGEAYGGEGIQPGHLLPDCTTLTVGSGTLSLQKTDFALAAGPVFDGSGNVQGFLCRPIGAEEGEGLMLPAAQLMDIATQIVEKGYVTGRPCLGLQVRLLSNFYRQYWGLEGGLEVIESQANGLLSGDILLSANGQSLTHCSQLHRLLLETQPGDSISLEVFRAGRRFTVELPVTQQP